MTWAAGVRREIISDRARSSSSTPDPAPLGGRPATPALGPRWTTLADASCCHGLDTCAGVRLCVATGDPSLSRRGPGPPRCAVAQALCGPPLSLHPPHQQQHRTAPHYEHLRHRSAPHRARASIGRRGRLSLHSSYIKRPRSSSLQGASVCAPTDRPQRTSLQRQRRRRPRVGHRHAPEGEKENPRLARNGSE